VAGVVCKKYLQTAKLIFIILALEGMFKYGYRPVWSMPYKVKMPQVDMVLNKDVDSILNSLAKKHQMTRASMARGLLRLGMEMYDQNPEKVLELANVGEC
jgi:phosphopantetheine adenylyltransferase